MANTPNLDYISYGRDFNFFQKIAVSATGYGSNSADGYTCDAIITFPTYTVMFTNYSAANATNSVVEYSFNGNITHGELNPLYPASISKIFQNRVVSKIWFRVQSGSTGTITVAVEAWGIR